MHVDTGCLSLRGTCQCSEFIIAEFHKQMMPDGNSIMLNDPPRLSLETVKFRILDAYKTALHWGFCIRPPNKSHLHKRQLSFQFADARTTQQLIGGCKAIVMSINFDENQEASRQNAPQSEALRRFRVNPAAPFCHELRNYLTSGI